MISAFSSSASGIKASFRMMDASAHNTANINTDGYKKQTVIMNETGSGVVVTLGRDYSAGPYYQKNGTVIEGSNSEYTQEAVSRITAVNMLKANTAAFRCADEMQRCTLDIKA
ncbi:MAG: hypothetical protein HYS21_01720 [Deltaproteobacteria bacterium]|nr:hypothetical protein [Deltaproteobacteria bacterium]